MKFEDSWENNTHQDVEDAIKDKVEEIEGRIDDVGDSVPDTETIEAIRQAAQDAQDAAAAVGDIINENSGRVSHAKAPAVVLRYIHQNGTDDMSLDDLNAGDVYADAGGSLELVVIENGSKTVKNIGTIDKGLIFYSIREEGFFRYLGSAAWELLSQGGEEEQEGTFAELDVDSRLKHIQSPVMVLDCISQSEEPGIADCPIGGYYCYMGNQASACRIRYRKPLVTAGQYQDIDLSSPQGHVLYYNKPEDKTYHWDGQKLVAVLWHAGLAIDNRLMSSRATAVVLRYISANLDDGETPMGANSGDVYCDSNNHIIVRGGTVNPDKEYVTAASLPTTPDADLGLPDQKLVYYDVNKKGFYRWNGVEWKKALNIDIDTTNLVTFTQLNNTLSSYATKSYVDQAVQQAEQPETVVINSDGANIVDEHNNNSVLLAPSARQMKLMYDNFIVLYNSLANIAFTDGKPTLDWAGTKTKYTLSYGTLTGCTADVAAGQVNEGALRIKLTPTQASYAFTSVTVNGESASTTATGDADGSVYLDIVVNGNITIAATAISGRSISFDGGGGCTIDAASVANGQDLDTIIRAKEHYTLPSSITVTIGGSSVAHTYTRAQDNKTATLHIDAANITGDLAITCTAVEDNHAVLTFGQLSNVTIKSGTRELESGSHIYDGETISIKPASGYKLTGKPIFTNGNTTPITLNPTTEGDIYNGYDFVFNPLPNSTIAITNVGATELSHTLRASLTGTGGESVDSSTDLSSNITEGSAWSTVLSVKSTAEEGTAITSVIPAMEGGGTISYDSNTKRVQTDCVTGHITITVTVATVSRRTITLPTNEHVIVKASDNSTVLKAADNTAPTNPKVTEGEPFSCYISAEEVEQKIIGYNSPYTSYELSNVRITMGSQDVTETSLDRSSGKITINAVTGAVAITTDSIAFDEGLSIGSNGDFVKQDVSYYADNNNLDHCCTKDYIPIPSDKGITKIIAGAGGKYGVRDNFLPYIAFYKYDNGSYEFISSVCIGQKSSGTPSWFMGAAVPITKNEEQVYPTHFRIGFKTDIDQSDTVTIGGTTTGKRVNSLRKKRFVIGLDAQNNVTYLYRGIGYDGRYEDREGGYGISWCTALNMSNSIVQDQYMSGCVTKLISVGGASTLDCALGKLQPYDSKYSNILFFDQNENFISGVKTSDTSDTSALTEKAVTVPSNAAYFRLTTANPDEAYVKNHDNGEYLYKGIYVTDN